MQVPAAAERTVSKVSHTVFDRTPRTATILEFPLGLPSGSCDVCRSCRMLILMFPVSESSATIKFKLPGLGRDFLQFSLPHGIREGGKVAVRFWSTSGALVSTYTASTELAQTE